MINRAAVSSKKRTVNRGQPITTAIEVGQCYHVQHRDRGTFDVRIIAFKNKWVTAEIVSGSHRWQGRLAAIGERVSFTDALAVLTKIEAEEVGQ